MSGEAMTRKERHDRVGSIREKMLGRTEDFERALSDIIPPESFVQIALTAIAENEDLLGCSAESILLASLKAAQAGLRLDSRQAALVPYKGRATFVPMVQGVLDLIARSPGVAKVEARAVREGDDFAYQYGSNPDLRHVPSAHPTGSRRVSHAYAIVWWMSGAPPTFEVLDRDEIEAARRTSRAPNSPAWRDWYGEMARKTAVHRISKYVDLAPETARRLDHVMDAEWKGMNGRPGPSLSPGGPPIEEGLDDLNARIAAKRDDGEDSEGNAHPDEDDDSPPTEGQVSQVRSLMDKAEVDIDEAEGIELAIADENGPAVREAIRDLQKRLVEADEPDEQEGTDP